MRVLIADSDPDYMHGFTKFLRARHVVVEQFASLTALDHVLDTGKPAIVVLDLDLGVCMGVGFLHHLLRARSCPSVVLSSRHDEMDRAATIQLGADAYLDKNVHYATVLSTLRNLAAARDVQRPPGGWRMDPAGRTLIGPLDRPLQLTSAEFDLFCALYASQGRPVGRDQLFAAVFGRRYDPLDRAVDTLVAKLRDKLARGGAVRPMILTVRSRGYLFTGFPPPFARQDSTLESVTQP